MSFILDALKKSETDRQRQSGPSLFEVKVAPPRRRLPAWAVAIAVLLGVNLIVVSWMLLRHPSPAKPAAAAADVPAQTPHAAAAAGEGPTGSSSARESPAAPLTGPEASPSPGIPAPGTAPAARATAADAPATAEPPPAGTAAGAAASAASNAASGAAAPLPGAPSGGGRVWVQGSETPSGTPADSTSDSGSTSGSASSPASAGSGPALPLYQQLASESGATLPQLHLDLHVYSSDPRKSYVMINMHELREGDSLPDGVRVLAIRPDGVVLSYQGKRFLLPRD